MKGKKKYIVIAMTFVFLICFVFLIIKLTKTETPELPDAKIIGDSGVSSWLKKHPDAGYRGYLDLEQNDYQVVYISSYMTRKLDMEHVSYVYGLNTEAYTWLDGSSSEIVEVLEIIQESVDQWTTIYLELDVLKLGDTTILEAIKNFENVTFYIYFTPYTQVQWAELIDSSIAYQIIDIQTEIVSELLKVDNVTICAFNDQDWMTKNPIYFAESRSMSEDGVGEIFNYFHDRLIDQTGQQINFLNEDNLEEKLIIPSLELNEYEDFQGKTIFYLGDSMYGKDKGDSGIPDISSGLLNANGYNFGIGGSSVTGSGISDLSHMVDLIIGNYNGKLANVDIPESVADIFYETENMIPHYIILRYGYNDYIGQKSLDVDGEFRESLMDNIQKLKERFPTSTIVLSTPMISTLNLEMEQSLDEYVDVMVEVASELEILCLLNYDVDVFVPETIDQYLIDRVHYNVIGRFLQAERLAEFLSEIER